MLRSKMLWRSKSQGHADMAARKAQPLVKSLRIDAGVMRQQFDQSASPGPHFHHRPLHHLLADAAAAAAAGDADILDQAARGALRAQPRQNAELQAADHGALAVLGHDKLDVRVAVDGLERREIALRQRVLDPFTTAAERIVRQHGDDDADILAAGTADGDLCDGRHEDFR
jgi:hypothetical protein